MTQEKSTITKELENKQWYLFMRFAYCHNCHGGDDNCKCKIMEAKMEFKQFQEALSFISKQILEKIDKESIETTKLGHHMYNLALLKSKNIIIKYIGNGK